MLVLVDRTIQTDINVKVEVQHTLAILVDTVGPDEFDAMVMTTPVACTRIADHFLGTGRGLEYTCQHSQSHHYAPTTE